MTLFQYAIVEIFKKAHILQNILEWEHELALDLNGFYIMCNQMLFTTERNR